MTPQQEQTTGRYVETEGQYGITWEASRSKWRVQACVSGKNLRIGRYSDRELARAVADWVAILVKHRGAKRNFPVRKPACWNLAEAETRLKLSKAGFLL